MKTLDELRKEIDLLDNALIQVIAKRMEIVQEIGKIKKEMNIEPLDEQRWQNILKRINGIAKKYHLSEDLVKKIYEEIHHTALTIEKNL
jgi:chorismate mutase